MTTIARTQAAEEATFGRSDPPEAARVNVRKPGKHITLGRRMARGLWSPVCVRVDIGAIVPLPDDALD